MKILHSLGVMNIPNELERRNDELRIKKKKKLKIGSSLINLMGFSHTIEVIFAKVCLRLARGSLIMMKQRFDIIKERQKDKRIQKLLNTRLVKRLKKRFSNKSPKAAFLKWHVLSRPNFIHACIRKLTCIPRLNHLVAVYRMLNLVRKLEKNPSTRFAQREGGLTKIISVFHRLNDKYNSKHRILGVSFSLMKNLDIKMTKLIAFEALLAKLIEKYNHQSEAFCKVRLYAKKKLITTKVLVSSIKIKMRTAYLTLVNCVKFQNREISMTKCTFSDLEILERYQNDNTRKMITTLLSKMKKEKESLDLIHSVVHKLFLSQMRQFFVKIQRKQSKRRTIAVNLLMKSDKYIKREQSHAFVYILSKYACFELRTHATKSKVPRDRIRSKKETTIVHQNDVSEIKYIKFICLFNKILNRKKSFFWRELVSISHIKKIRQTRNFFTKWSFVNSKYKANLRLRYLAKIIRGNHNIIRVWKRLARPDIKRCLRSIRIFGFVCHKMSLPFDFNRDLPILRLLLKIEKRKLRVGLFTIIGLYHLNKKMASQNLIQKRKRYPNGASPAACGVDPLTQAIQSQRVRKGKITPLKSDQDQSSSATVQTQNGNINTSEMMKRIIEEDKRNQKERFIGDLLTHHHSNRIGWQNDNEKNSKMHGKDLRKRSKGTSDNLSRAHDSYYGNKSSIATEEKNTSGK